jgi:hypothetical protein
MYYTPVFVTGIRHFAKKKELKSDGLQPIPGLQTPAGMVFF